jgi:hypothetical protein
MVGVAEQIGDDEVGAAADKDGGEGVVRRGR